MLVAQRLGGGQRFKPDNPGRLDRHLLWLVIVRTILRGLGTLGQVNISLL